MDTPQEKRTQFWLGIIISALCVLIILWLIEPAEIATALRTANYAYLAACALGIILFLIFRAIRWRLMLDNDVSWAQTFHIQNIGYMLGMLMPFRLGDLARAILIGNVPKMSFSRGATTMVVERILDLLFFVVLLPFTLSSIERLPEPLQTGATISGLIGLFAIGLLIVAANQRPFVNRLATAVLDRIPFMQTEQWLKQVNYILDGLNKLTNWRDGLLLIFWSIMIWLPILAIYYLVMLSVGLTVTPLAAALVTCIAAFSVAAPSSPGQIGVFHLAVIAALTELLNQPENPATAFAILYHTTQFLVFIIMGLLGLFGAGTTFRHVISVARSWRQTNQPETES